MKRKTSVLIYERSIHSSTLSVVDSAMFSFSAMLDFAGHRLSLPSISFKWVSQLESKLVLAINLSFHFFFQIEHRSLVLTLAHMRTLRPQLCINPSFLRILRKVERDAIRRPSRDVGPVTETPAMAIKFVSGIQRFMTKTPTTGQLLSAPLGLSSTGTPADNRLLFAKTGRLASFHRSIKQAWS